MAFEANTVVLATGNVPPWHAHLEAETREILRATCRRLMCMGQNRTGFAKHPLYLRRDTALRPFEAAT
jgi:hypothetical protein